MEESVEKTYKEEEYTRDDTPYIAYFQSLREVFDLSIVGSFADMGCNNGGLLNAVKSHFNETDIIGYDYFQWAKDYAPTLVKESIIITDLSKKETFKKQYSLVNCSEVGEHIPKEAEDIFLNNLADISSDILLLTWSNEYDNEGQHLNPRPKSYIIERMKERGFSHWKERAKSFSDVLANKLEGIGYNWWAENMMVFKREKFAHVHSDYFIQGISTDNTSHKKYFTKGGLVSSSFQNKFISLTSFIHRSVASRKATSIVRVGDGDYFFLRKISRGSAAVGKRALTISYENLDIETHRKLFWQNDHITISSEKHDQRSWLKFIVVEFVEKVILKVFKKKATFKNQKVAYGVDKLLTPFVIFGILPQFIAYVYSFKRKGLYYKKATDIIENNGFPLETVYALVATKWIFKNFKNDIGIIASENKIKLIQELMKREEYRKYLGVESFCDYIAVPEKGAANNVLPLSKEVGEKIKGSNAKIFLVGIGSAKLALVPLLKHYNDAVFIDVGGGIDAIAGILCQDRPYFAEWTNYRIKGYDYSTIDFMDQGNPSWDNKEYHRKDLD